MGRLQLLVEVLQRVNRMLNESDQKRYGEFFGSYLNQQQAQVSQRCRRSAAEKKEGRNLRTAVEAPSAGGQTSISGWKTACARQVSHDLYVDFFLRFFNIAYQAPGWRIDPV